MTHRDDGPRGKLENVIWLSGADLVARILREVSAEERSRRAERLIPLGLFRGISSDEETLTSALDELWSRGPTLFLADFSRVKPQDVFRTTSGTGLESDDPPCLNQALSRFCGMAARYGHKMIVGLPRFMTPFLVSRQLHGSFVTPARLFSPTYRGRADYCQTILRPDCRLDDVLKELLCANSSTLPAAVATFLNKFPVRDPTDIAPTLELARALVRDGFYEIAYRLELHCRTGIGHDPVSLAANVYRSRRIDDGSRRERLRNDEESRVVGYLGDLKNVPMAGYRRAVLTGEPGAGKSTTLLAIEKAWSLPRTDTHEDGMPDWLPFLLDLSTHGELDLVEQIRYRLAANASVTLPRSSDTEPPACHKLLHDIRSPDVMHWLFSSPVYLLIDGVDELLLQPRPERRREKLEGQIADLSQRWGGELGCLLACRQENAPLFSDCAAVEIRPMDGGQADALAKSHEGAVDLFALRNSYGNLTFGHLGNPYFLSLLSRTPGLEIETLSLARLFEAHVAHVTHQYSVDSHRDPRTTETVTRLIVELLPAFALDVKKRSLLEARLEDHVAAQFAGHALRLGFLKSDTGDGRFQFSHGLLCDYFAAKQLARDARKSGVVAAVSHHLTDVSHERYPYWDNVFKILLGLLEHDEARDLITFLATLDSSPGQEEALRLTLECLHVLPDIAKRFAPARHVIESAKEIVESSASLNTRLTFAEALGHLDTRIANESPLTGMVEIRGTDPGRTFRMGRYPVTNMEFARFVRAGGYEEEGKRFWEQGWEWRCRHHIRFPRYWFGADFQGANYPVVGVSVFESMAYCRWLTATSGEANWEFKLPDFDQWDCAAFGDSLVSDGASRMAVWAKNARRVVNDLFRTTSRPMPPANQDERDDSSEDLVSQLCRESESFISQHEEALSYRRITPVGVFRPNRVGLYDVFGYTWEWCCSRPPLADSALPGSDSDDPEDVVIVKGGSWRGSKSTKWTLFGGWFEPHTRFHRLGFRICGEVRA